MLKAVLDTNVLVSAVISDGKARQLLKKGIVGKYRIVSSDLILNELVVVLCRPKFKTSEAEIQRITAALSRTADIITVKTKIEVVKADPKDDMVIETAIDGKANLIVSGDNHLLGLGSFREIEIVTIEKMLEYINADS
jgi:uncharacterized protein